MVRIVAYILRQTIGWLDKDGMPINQQIKVSYRDLIEKAGVSRGAIGPAIQRAVAMGFIECRIEGKSKTEGQTSQTAEYAIRWDEGGDYTISTIDRGANLTTYRLSVQSSHSGCVVRSD